MFLTSWLRFGAARKRRRIHNDPNRAVYKHAGEDVRDVGKAELLEDRVLLAGTQVFTPAPAAIASPINSAVQFDVSYITGGADGNNQKTTGVTLRMHYKSSELTPDIPAITASAFAGATVQDSADNANADGDAATDRFVNFLWFDFQGNFPAGQDLPVTLFTASFTTSGTFDGEAVKFSGSPPIGFTFQSTPAQINLGAANPNLNIADAPIVDEGGNSVFPVTLSAAAPAGGVVVTYSTADDSATAGADYTAQTAQTITIAAGQTTGNITVATLTDNAVEQNETFNVNITNATNATIVDGTGVGTIRDVAPAPTVAIAPAVTVAENAGPAVFNVTLSAASTQTVTVAFNTANGTAVAPGDYTATANGTVTFTPGQTTRQISIPITNDAVAEQTENFTVTLSAPTNATLGNALGTATITDDDAVQNLPTVTIANAPPVVEGNAATFTVTLSAASAQVVTVNYNTTNGTAIAPGDFTAAVNGTVTIAAGQTTSTFTVATVDDPTEEGTENFTVAISNPVNAALGANVTATGTINDNDGNPPGQASISGRKFDDANRNGAFDAGEEWLNGWDIQLVLNGQVVATSTTADVDLNGDGNIDPTMERGVYRFNLLDPATYTVQEVQRAGWEQTTPTTGTDATAQAAYDLDQALGLFDRVIGGQRVWAQHDNWGGLNEIWFQGNDGTNGQSWYYITPAGAVFRWDGTSGRTNLTGTQVATLSPAYHANLPLLTSAQQPVGTGAASGHVVMIVGNQVVVGRDFGNARTGVVPGDLDCENHELVAAAGGNVKVTFKKGKVNVKGDNNHNAIEASSDGFGNVIIRGLGGTTINGSAEPLVLLGDTALTKVTIDMKRGDDLICLHDLDFAGDVKIKTSSGHDVVLGQSVHVGGDVQVKTGTDNDTVAFSDVFVGGNTKLATSRGVSAVVLVDSDLGSVDAKAGSDSDLVYVKNTSIAGDAKINLSSGNDAIKTVATTINGDVDIDGGKGFDQIEFNGPGIINDSGISNFELDEIEVDAEDFLDIVLSDLADIGFGNGNL